MDLLPLISITIPTYNSAKTIDTCLRAIKNQTYHNYEIIVIDSYSTDDTLKIAKSHQTVKILQYDGGLLGARIAGLNHAHGKYILLLDSDQILDPRTLENAYSLAHKGGYQMLALTEGVYKCNTFIEWLYSCDRKIIESEKDYDPATSVILPRFFETNFLKSVIYEIPKNIITTVGGPDHAIIYYEAWQKTHKITSVPHAVFHTEPDTLKKVILKSYRWGATGASAKTITEYKYMMQTKERFRKGLFNHGLIIESFASLLLLILKGIPYKIGYYKAKYNISK
jgi:glycosyltransferase involved in cell wall biosynthesis